MSNFAGVWRFDGPVQPEELARLSSGLEAVGILRPRVWQAGNIAIVHRQHRFTPEDCREAMPLEGRSGICVAADCRLNDRASLSGRLSLAATKTDGELILASFESWGADAPIYLYGDFAAAVWEARGKRLVFARDPAGFRSLYYYRGARLIVFATCMRALLNHAEVPRELDDDALGDFLTLNNGPRQRTIYRAISRLPLGHVAVLDQHGSRVAPYWSMPEPGTLRRASDRAYEEEARAVLDAAVRDAWRAQSRPTLLLTGGLDSASIAESATRQLAPSRVLAATRVPATAPRSTADAYHDETARVRLIAERLPGLDWHAITGETGDWRQLDFDRRFFLAGAAPTRAPQNASWFFPVYGFMAEQGSRVSIGGEMGNAFFSYSGLEFLPRMFLTLQWGGLIAEIRGLARRTGVSFPWMFAHAVLRPFEPLSSLMRRRGAGNAPWGRHSALAPGTATARMNSRLDRSLYRMRLAGSHPSVQALRQWILYDEVAFDFGNTLRSITGIEHRLPLADRRVIEFFGALPREQFLRGGMTRRIARRLLDKKLPDEIVWGRKRGVQNGDWYDIVSAQCPDMRASVERLSSRPRVAEIVDLHRLGEILDQWPADIESAEKNRRKCLNMLTRGMEMARFIAWHEGGNA